VSSIEGKTKSELAAGRRRAVAQDVKARGGNPVQVSDLRQRNGVGNSRGRAFLTTLLKGGGR
jgi:hypothetical protein